MAQHGKFKGDQQAFLATLQGLRPEVRGAPLVQWVMRLRAAFAAGNFVRFFLLVREAPYLPACMAHIYFPGVRARALRTLSETLSPSAARPAMVELSWLCRALMLDSEEEAVQLCAMHGFSNFVGGEVALVKGSYMDPPPPVPRHPSAAVSAKAPGARSICVTSPATRPLTPEEAAALKQEAQRAEEERQRAAAAARAAAEAEAVRRQQEALAAAAEARRLEVEAQERQRLAEEQLRREEEARLEAQRKKEEEARQAAEAAAAAAAAERERLVREAAERERRAAAARAAEEAARRAAAEAETRRLEEERRRREAEETERRRKAAELRQRALSRRYYHRWVAEARRRVAVRLRQERIDASLKACRVGALPAEGAKVGLKNFNMRSTRIEWYSANFGNKHRGLKFSPCTLQAGGISAQALAVTEAALHSLDLGAALPQARQVPLDMCSVVAPLLAQRTPSAQHLMWKVAVLDLTGPTAPSDRQLVQWLRYSLGSGQLVASPSGTAYVSGPSPLSPIPGTEATAMSICAALPSTDAGVASWALAGTSAIVVPATGKGSGAATVAAAQQVLGNLAKRLPSGAPAVPILFAGTREEDATAWAEAWQGVAPGHPCHAMSLALSGTSGAKLEPLSRQTLVQGVRWLAANSPPQPSFRITTLEDTMRDTLDALMPSASEGLGDGNASELVDEAKAVVLAAVDAAGASPEAAWQWPPPELSSGAMRHWYAASKLAAVRASLDEFRGLQGSLGASPASLYLGLGELEGGSEAVVLPSSVDAAFQEALTALRNRPPWSLPAHKATPSVLPTRDVSPSRLQKRKWRHSPESAAASAGEEAAHVRLRRDLDQVEQRLLMERGNQDRLRAELSEFAAGHLDGSDGAAAGAAVVHSVATLPAVEPAPGSGILQQLNAQLKTERKASDSLWQRMRSMAASLF